MSKGFLLLCFYANLSASVYCRHTLYVGALLELTNNWFEDYAEFFVDIWEYVFEEIGNRTDILQDYSLQLIIKDTQDLSGLAGRRMFELMSAEEPVICILGPTFSPGLTVVGQLTPYYDVLQISYAHPISTTVEQQSFPTLFLVNHIRDNLNPIRIKMMQYFNWTRVGTIFVQSDVQVSEMVNFHDLLKQHNMTLVTSAIIPNQDADLSYMLARLKQYDARIIMASFSWNYGPKIFCAAYKAGLYGSDYVWIIVDTSLGPGWIRESAGMLEGLNCTMNDLLAATDGYFSLNFGMLTSLDTVTVSGKTAGEIITILEDKLEKTDYQLSPFYTWVYDSAWALAFGLNNSLHYLNDTGLNEYTNNPYYLNAILKGMREVTFEGLSGPVSFDQFGGRIGVTKIEQNFNDSLKIVAMYNQINDNLTWLVTLDQLWPDGSVPRDKFIYHRILVAPNVALLVLVLIVNTFCCCVAISFLGFNIYYRENSIIKLSSPMINNIMIVGSIMMFICVFITSLDYGRLMSESATKSVCMVRIWVMCFGFTSLFGALFSKTWRVHKIFRDLKMKRTVIKDYHLFGVIGFLLLCDCILLVPWSATHALHKQSGERSAKNVYSENVVVSEVYTYCHHPYEMYWFVSVYVYKGLLLAFGCFLAWETRHVTVAALNDSKYIGFCIYNVVIVCVFGVPLAHVLPQEETTLNFVLLTSLVMFCTTLCLCLLFIPKTKMRNKVSERFLNPSLNSVTRPQASVPVTSSPKHQTRCERDNITEMTRDDMSKDVSLEVHPAVEELKLENNRLRLRMASETIALARLKRDILHITGNIHFYKVGDKYVVFKAEESYGQLETSDVKGSPEPGDESKKERKNAS